MWTLIFIQNMVNLWRQKDLYLGENCTDGKEYKNLVLPKNAQITLDDNMELRLTPSEKVSTTDYYQYYNY